MIPANVVPTVEIALSVTGLPVRRADANKVRLVIASKARRVAMIVDLDPTVGPAAHAVIREIVLRNSSVPFRTRPPRQRCPWMPKFPLFQTRKSSRE